MGAIKKETIYVVAKGMFKNKVFLTSNTYSFYQATTNDVLRALWFRNYSDAEKLANKAGGAVYEYELIPLEEEKEDE